MVNGIIMSIWISYRMGWIVVGQHYIHFELKSHVVIWSSDSRWFANEGVVCIVLRWPQKGLNAFWVYDYANAALLAPSVVFFSRHEYLRCGKKGLTLLRSPTAFRDSRAISTLQFPYKSMPLSLNSDRKENFKLNSE